MIASIAISSYLLVAGVLTFLLWNVLPAKTKDRDGLAATVGLTMMWPIWLLIILIAFSVRTFLGEDDV